ncbi:MAG: hypothetical protein ACREOC_06170 [Gemmatimonadales bacterium]
MSNDRQHDNHTLSSREHWRASLWLCVMLLLLAFVLVPLLRDLPLGATTRTGLLAWLLVLLALYWLYAGMGFQPLLLLQLVVFSAAAVLLSTKAVLVLVGIERLSVLRRVARALILVGATLAGLNLVALLLVPRWRRPGGNDRGTPQAPAP